MASQGEPDWNSPRSGNLEFRSHQGPANQEGEEVMEVSFPSLVLISFNHSCQGQGKAEMLSLCQAFSSWLQPEKNSKEEMIFSLALEQFLLKRPHRDRAMWQEKWESSGRDLKSFMDDLGDEDLSPPCMVHVQMQGQEALFSENMLLGQVVAYFTEQHSAADPEALTPETPSPTPTDTSEPTGPGDAGEHGDTFSSEDHQPRSPLILQGESCPGPAGGAQSWESPRSPRAASPGASTAQEGLPGEETLEETQEETQGETLEETREETPEETREETLEETREETREAGAGSPGSARKLYSCDRCPQVFRYLSRFLLHQRRHNNERPCVCATCGKGFFQASDLRVHQRIHAREKPFRCGRCGRAFSHRTNLRAHELIHTGVKPYACAECGKAYRQSSTYHRHLRMHQRKASTSGASTCGASISGASTSGASTSGAPTSGASTSGDSTSGASTCGASISGASTSGDSTSRAPTSGAPTSGDSTSGDSTPRTSTSRVSMSRASTPRDTKPSASSLSYVCV